MANDVWSLGIILLNLATGRNPWKSAALTDPTFHAYCRNPTGFLPTVLPISPELNDLVVRMLALDWAERITLEELREAIEEVDFFYSEGVVFDGSMARCPWEVGMDIDGDSNTSEAEVEEPVAHAETTHSNLKSVWSTDSESESEMVFARHSTVATSLAASWTAYSNDLPSRSLSEDDADSDPYSRPQTPAYPPSLLTTSGSSPSLPQTPDAFSTTFPPLQRPPVLRINTSCCKTQQGFQPFEDSMSVVSYVTATSTATNPYAPSSMYLSAGHGDDESIDVRASLVMNDKPMTSPSVWQSSSSHASFSSISSSSASSSIQCDIPSPTKDVPPISAALVPPPSGTVHTQTGAPFVSKKRIEDVLGHVFQRSRSPSPAPAPVASRPLPGHHLSIPRETRRKPYFRGPMHWLSAPAGKIFSAGTS
jgi:serine/threonine-protein kinase ULK1